MYLSVSFCLPVCLLRDMSEMPSMLSFLLSAQLVDREANSVFQLWPLLPLGRFGSCVGLAALGKLQHSGS